MKKLLVIMSVMAMMLTMASCGTQTVEMEEPENIETVEIWVNPMLGLDVEDDIYSSMESSPATYFTGDNDSENFGFHNIIQTDKETFESRVTNIPANKITKGIAENIKDLLNTDFACSLDKEYEELFDKVCILNIDFDYFVDSEVKLKCENVTVKKICAANHTGSSPFAGVDLYCIGTVDVTTVASNGDMSNTVFGAVGETVTLKFRAFGGGFNVPSEGYAGYLNDVELIR